MKTNCYLLLLLLSSTLILSCNKNEPAPHIDDSTFGIRHDKVLADYTALADIAPINTPDFSSVVCLTYSLDGSLSDEFLASGVLIHPNWVLTTGSNFFVEDEQDFPAPASGIQVRIGNDPNNPDRTVGVEEIVFHPTWLSENGDFAKGNDLCLLKLSEPVENITIAELYPAENESVNYLSWFCGFGDFSHTDEQHPELYTPKRALSNQLDRVVGGLSTSMNSETYIGGLLAFDFDHPDGSINSLGDAFIGAEEAILGDAYSTSAPTNFEGCTVSGDAGGPLFVLDGTLWRVAGILHGDIDEPVEDHVTGEYGAISVFTRLAPQLDWILETTQ